jgi:succinyl-CoA synthetase alpha subunit
MSRWCSATAGTYEGKVAALQTANVRVAEVIEDIPRLLRS